MMVHSTTEQGVMMVHSATEQVVVVVVVVALRADR